MNHTIDGVTYKTVASLTEGQCDGCVCMSYKGQYTKEAYHRPLCEKLTREAPQSVGAYAYCPNDIWIEATPEIEARYIAAVLTQGDSL